MAKNLDKVYLKKYCKKYRIKRAEDGVWEIMCKRGFIYPFSAKKKWLCFYFNGEDKPKSKGYMLGKLKKVDYPLEIINDGDFELIIRFREALLPHFEKLFEIKKKKVFSESHMKKLIKVLRKTPTWRKK